MMGLFGPKSTRLILHIAQGEPEAETLLIRLRSGAASAQLEEYGWSPEEKAESTVLRQGVRRHLYRVQDRPEACMDFRALTLPGGAGRLELILTGSKADLAEVAPVLERIGASLQQQAGLARPPQVKGVTR